MDQREIRKHDCSLQKEDIALTQKVPVLPLGSKFALKVDKFLGKRALQRRIKDASLPIVGMQSAGIVERIAEQPPLSRCILCIWAWICWRHNARTHLPALSQQQSRQKKRKGNAIPFRSDKVRHWTGEH